MPRCIEKTFASINVALTAKGKNSRRVHEFIFNNITLMPTLILNGTRSPDSVHSLFPPFASFHNAAQTQITPVAKARTRQSERAVHPSLRAQTRRTSRAARHQSKPDPTRLFIALANGSARTAKSFAPTNVANTTVRCVCCCCCCCCCCQRIKRTRFTTSTRSIENI